MPQKDFYLVHQVINLLDQIIQIQSFLSFQITQITGQINQKPRLSFLDLASFVQHWKCMNRFRGVTKLTWSQLNTFNHTFEMKSQCKKRWVDVSSIPQQNTQLTAASAFNTGLITRLTWVGIRSKNDVQEKVTTLNEMSVVIKKWKCFCAGWRSTQVRKHDSGNVITSFNVADSCCQAPFRFAELDQLKWKGPSWSPLKELEEKRFCWSEQCNRRIRH